MSKLAKFWKENKGLFLFLFLMLFIRSAIADWYHIPSGSMQPTILIGDRVLVNKLAYDVKIPFTGINLNRHAEPKRGDIIVFDSKASDDRLIKRVIGVSGDTIEMRRNHLFINNKLLDVRFVELGASFDRFMNDRNEADYYREELPPQLSDKADLNSSITTTKGDISKPYFVRIKSSTFSPLSSFPSVVVPPDYLWVMGDNRDNSADSRVIGMIPREELIGRAERVLISFDKNNYYIPRDGRYSVEL